MLDIICGTSFTYLFTYLWNKLPPILYVFLISLVHHHHPALLHHHALILDRLLTFFMAFSTFVVKSSFFKVLSSIAISLLLMIISCVVP